MMKGLHIGSLHRSISGYDRICYLSFDVLAMLVGILQKLLQKFLVLLCMAQLGIHSEKITTFDHLYDYLCYFVIEKYDCYIGE